MTSLQISVIVGLLFFLATVCHRSSSQASVPSKIGLIPWGNVTEDVIADALSSDSLSVITVSVNLSKSTYTRMENTYTFMESENLLALLGPYKIAVALAAESLHVPYLSVTDVASESRNHTFSLSPSMADVGLAIYDVARYYAWSKISIFYDDDRGVMLMEKLMTNHTMTVRGWRLKQLAQDDEVKKSLVEMRKVLVVSSVVLCNLHNTNKILEQARGLAMLSTPPYQWLFYDPGLGVTDLLLSFHDIDVNFTVLSHLPLPLAQEQAPPHGIDRLDHSYVTQAADVLTSAYDDVRLRGAGGGSSVAGRKEMSRAIREKGMFGDRGEGSNLTLYVIGLTGSNQTMEIGKWRPKVDLFHSRLHMNGWMSDINNKSTTFPLKGRTVKVVMIEEPPFTMLKKDEFAYTGNNRFEGFAVDLIAEVAGMLDFNYKIYLVEDGNFGSKQSDGEWNGMIGELLAGNAAMSVAPLSINSDREEVVDFTKPFMTRYINVLMRVPQRETSYFEFLNPLSPLVWICTLCAFVVVSVVLYVLERMGTTPLSAGSSAAGGSAGGGGGGGGGSASGDDNRGGAPRITMRESFWFIFGSLLQGNTDSSPSTIPGRILTSAWWFFALILISSYTANLAAFLTVKKINTPIKSVTDLAQQSRIKYGTVKNSGVMGFFKNTNIEHFAKMWAHMSEIDPNSMVDNTTVGFSKVKEEEYAFFWDTTVNKFQTIKDCDFMEIGPPFDPKGFGIGVPPGATYREALSMAILRLSDWGRLHELETKYWGGRNCPDLTKSTSDETSELQIENVAGVFFILVGGIVIAAVVCLGEYVGHELLRASRLDSQPTAAKSHNSETFL